MGPYHLTLNVRLNLQSLMNVDRFQKKNQSALISVAAQRYFKYLRNRFISNASGGNQWPPLKESTIERKERRGIADNPEWRLREYDYLLNSMGVKIIGKQTRVGFVKDRRHPRGKTVFQLIKIHGRGEGGLPIRQAIGLPNRSTSKQMAKDVRDQYNKLIRKNRNDRTTT